MPIKTQKMQPVRLLPRTEPAPGRAARQQFRKSYAEETDTAEPDQTPPPETDNINSDEFHVGRIRRHAVIRQEPPPADEKPRDTDANKAAPTLTTRIARACARDEHANLRTTRLAAIIARFCNGPGILDSGGWQLQIAIDPALLPATRLHLTLSSCRLSLRFETTDPDTRRVILDNSKELQHRLSTLLPAQIEVDIVCW